MTATSLHPTPSDGTIATEEFRAVGLALRTEMIFFVGALVLFAVLIIWNAIRFVHTHQQPGSHMGFRYDTAGAIPMFLVGLLIPFGVWRSEDPSRRAYHWSMPVARGPHTIMKLLSGWGWLMIGTAVYLLFIIGIATAVGAVTGEPAWDGTTPAWAWIVAFTAPTIGYLLTSIAVIGSDHPWRWIGGIVIGYGILLSVFSSFGMQDLAIALKTISDGSLGIKAALFGTVTEAARGMVIGAAGSAHPRMTVEMGDSLKLSTWIFAMPLWIIGSAIAVTIASYRHRE